MRILPTVVGSAADVTSPLHLSLLLLEPTSIIFVWVSDICLKLNPLRPGYVNQTPTIVQPTVGYFHFGARFWWALVEVTIRKDTLMTSSCKSAGSCSAHPEMFRDCKT